MRVSFRVNVGKLRSEFTISLFLVPQIHKQFGRGRTVAGIVIVAECKQLAYPLVIHHRFEEINPISQVASAVDDSLVPRRGLLLNPLAISKPANISEVRCNQVELLFHLPRPGHKRSVSQCQSDVVLPQHVRESSVEPCLVSNLDYKFVVRRKLLEERHQHSEKTFLLREFP